MRTVKYIILHCTATVQGKPFTAADIDRWHRARGWNGIGYHYVVRLDGTVEHGKICPYCGSEHTYLQQGNEFNIKEIEGC